MEHQISQCSLMHLALSQSKYNIQLLTRLVQECTHDRMRAATTNWLLQSIDLQKTLWEHLHDRNIYHTQEATNEEISTTRRQIADLYMYREH